MSVSSFRRKANENDPDATKARRDAEGRIRPGVNLRDLATFILTTMEGGVMQARTYGHPETFDASIRVLKDYFTHLLKEPV